MRALGRALGVDLRRSLLSGAFFLTVALMLAWMCFNSAHYLFNPAMWSQISAPKMLFIATCTSLGLAPLLFAIATVPYAWSFLQDRESGFENQAVERVGFWAYGFAKVLSVALSAFLAAAVSIGLFVGALFLLGLPETQPALEGGEGYLGFAASGHTVRYYLARITITGLSCSLASVFGLMMTAIIRNVFVGLLAPLVGYYLYSVLHAVVSLATHSLWITQAFRLSGILFYQAFEDPGFSFLWSSVVMLTMTALCAKGFLGRLRKEQGL